MNAFRYTIQALYERIHERIECPLARAPLPPFPSLPSLPFLPSIQYEEDDDAGSVPTVWMAAPKGHAASTFWPL